MQTTEVVAQSTICQRTPYLNKQRIVNQQRFFILPDSTSSNMVRIDHHEYLSTEEKRLKEDRERTKYWKKWGPYVSERQWATGQLSSFLLLFAKTDLNSPRGLQCRW
jgi:hypothetical protein